LSRKRYPRRVIQRARAKCTSYAAGRGAFRGSFENWSFRPGSRSADRTPFIVMRPKGLGASQLAPLQFVRLRTDKLRRIDTLYLDIDLIRTFRVDDNDKSFFADFYLSMRGNNASIDKIEFANGFLDPKTNDRQITIRKLHEAGPSDIYPEEMNIYLVSGKFTFEPRLATYPFDTQRFAINIQPKSSDAPFIIQPPPHSLRDKAVDTATAVAFAHLAALLLVNACAAQPLAIAPARVLHLLRNTFREASAADIIADRCCHGAWDAPKPQAGSQDHCTDDCSHVLFLLMSLLLPPTPSPFGHSTKPHELVPIAARD